MRHSVRRYRALFAELLETGDDGLESVDDVTNRDEVHAHTQNVERLR